MARWLAWGRIESDGVLRQIIWAPDHYCVEIPYIRIPWMDEPDVPKDLFEMKTAVDYAVKQLEASGRIRSTHDILTDLAKIIQDLCANAAQEAELPADHQWGRDAMEQFYYGRKMAVRAIRDMK